MAFYNRIGSILKQSITHSSAPAMMESLRAMYSTKLFIGGLSFGTDDGSLKDAFASFGEVVEARVITDRDSGRSRGFGFVSFSDTESANSAISAMDGQELQGRSIRVSLATERPPRPQFGGGGGYGGGGGGGYGGGGGGGYGSRGDNDGRRFGGRGGDDF